MSNICTRCGKERVISKTWDEVVEIYEHRSIITHTQFVCSDGECQKIVESQLDVQQKQKIKIEHQKEKEKVVRAKERARNIAVAKARH